MGRLGGLEGGAGQRAVVVVTFGARYFVLVLLLVLGTMALRNVFAVSSRSVAPVGQIFGNLAARSMTTETPVKKTKMMEQNLSVSPELAAVLGQSEIQRKKVMRHLWDYIIKHKLQAPDDKRTIICDDLMYKVFNQKEISMFQMVAKTNKHLTVIP